MDGAALLFSIFPIQTTLHKRPNRVLRRAALAIWLLVLCSVACPQSTTPKKRVAVLNFEDDTSGSIATSGAFGGSAKDAGKGISALLIEKLLQGGNYTVVDQSALKKALDEQNRSDADDADPYALAARIGRMLGLDAMIVGRITRFGPDPAPKDPGGSHSGMSTRKSKAYVDITARVLNMTTAEVAAVITATGESAHSGDVMRITVKAGHGQPKNTQEMLSGEFLDSLLSEATRNAVDQIAAQLNSVAEKIPTLRIEMDGLVAEVAGNSVTLNLGKKSGVKVGDKLVVLREVRAAADAQSGGSVPPVVEVVEKVGEATVTEAGDVYSTAVFSGPGQVHVGDHVKSASSRTPSH
jgi:curli biogenesis system outer membrane secretion channel CsgG